MVPLPQPFLLAGPTASGKSALAIALAEAVGGEIVNADPFQAWRGLEILTAQPGPDDRRRVPHHLYGFLPLDQDRDAATFSVIVRQTVDSLRDRGTPAIVVSGSGLYLRALTTGFDPGLPAPDPVLRAALEARPLPDLLAELEPLDPAEFARIDRNNARRVVRALEICLLTGGPASRLRTGRPTSAFCVRSIGIWLDVNRQELVTRIARRTESIFGADLEAEIRCLPPTDGICPTARSTLGLAEARAWVAGTLDRQSAIEHVAIRTRQYARRQATWFRRAPGLGSFHVDAVETRADTIRRLLGLSWGWDETVDSRPSPLA